MKRGLMLLVAIVIAMPAWARGPQMTPRGQNGEWMLVLWREPEFRSQNEAAGATTIHLGMSKIECVRALFASGAERDPSDVPYHYQMPVPNCEASGGKSVGRLRGSRCERQQEFGLISGGYNARGSCTNVTSGETASDLRRDDIQPFP